MTSKKSILRLARLAVIFSVTIGFFSFTGCAKKEPEVYKIGAILPLTGNLAFLGEPERDAIKLAVEDINAAGGIKGKKLEVVIEDSKGDPKQGAMITNKFISIDKIKAIVTSVTTIGLAAQPICDKNKIVQMALCMHPTITEGSPYTFRVFDNILQESELILRYIKNINVKKVVILYAKVPEQEMSAKDYLAPALKKMGIEVPLVESYEMTQRDFSSTVVKIKKYNPEVLAIMGFGHTYPPLFKALKQFGLLEKIKIVGGLGFLELPPGAPMVLFEGVVFVAPSFKVGIKKDKGMTFVEKYKKRYGKMPSFDAGYVYDSILMLAEAMKMGGYQPNKIKDTLLTFRKFEGVTGNIEILPNGDSRVDLVLSVYKNGVHIPLSEY